MLMGRKLSKIYTPYNRLLIPLFLLVVCAFTNCTANEITSSPLNSVNVVDGDSLEIGTKRIRLMGIDAPEYIQTCKNEHKKVYPCGKISAQYLRDLIGNNSITCKYNEKDRYDRYLCTCYKGNVNLNREMVLSGNAIPYLESEYKAEQTDAKIHKRGMWRGRFMQPRLFRRLREQEKK